MNKLIFILSLFLFACSFMGMKAEETWKHLDGLPCEETSSITQDAQGFLWFGTRLGLVRYDGYRLQIFRNDMRRPHAFSSCDIKSLAADRNGTIYAGAFYGLNIFDTHTHDIRITHLPGNDFIRALHVDKKENVWIGTYQGLSYMNPTGKLHDVASFPHDLVVQISEALDHQCYVATGNSGIYVFSAQQKPKLIQGTQSLKVRSLTFDQDGRLWFGTDCQGLYSYGQGQLVHYSGLDECYINDLLIHHARLYVATDKNLYRFALTSNGQIVDQPAYSSIVNRLKGKNIQDLYADRNGNIWASTDRQGIWFLRQNDQQLQVVKRTFTQQITPIISQFDVRHLADSTLWKTIPYINSLYEDSKGQIAIGTWNDGLYLTQGGQVLAHLNRSNTPWLKRNDIHAFASLAPDKLLFSSWEGLYLYDHAHLTGRFLPKIGKSDVSTMHTLCMSLVPTPSSSIHRTSSHNQEIWFGLVGGIAHVRLNETNPEKSSFTLYTHVNTPGIKNPKQVGALTDKHTESGEYQMGGIYRIVTDKQGNIWACTSEPGLLRYDAKQDCFRSVSSKLGILGDNVHSLDIDAQGDYWMTTNYGILKLSLTKDGTVRHQQLFTQENGLPSNYFGSTMSTRLADGRIAFLNSDHLIIASPNRSHTSVPLGSAQLSSLLVNNELLTDIEADLDALPPYTSRLTLTHEQNNLSLSFSSLSFGKETSTRFDYQLEGVDNDVQQTAIGENTIHYSQLQPGTYVLRYGLSGSTSEMRTLTIEILQPLWWRWWARLIYFCILLGITSFIILSLGERNRKNHQLALLAVEKQALDEQYRSKIQFYTRVIHEFLTPLTFMSELTHELQQKVRPALQATLFMLSSQTDKLLEAMNNTLDIREGDNSIQEALAKAQEMTQTDRDFLRRCTDSVNAHITDETYSHTVMMSEVGASHATLYRKLKVLTGMDATSFIRSIRLKVACQILSSEPNIRIAELAERVGFANPKYFSTCFKAEFGITPRKYNDQEKH